MQYTKENMSEIVFSNVILLTEVLLGIILYPLHTVCTQGEKVYFMLGIRIRLIYSEKFSAELLHSTSSISVISYICIITIRKVIYLKFCEG